MAQRQIPPAILTATALVLLLIGPALLPVGPAWAQASSAACDLDVSRTMTAGLAGQNPDGVATATEPIPAACIGASFTLQGSNPGDDFDICFRDAGGVEITCSTASGDEAGTIPEGTVEGEILYWAGAAGTYTLQASDQAPLEGPLELYLRSDPTHLGHVDALAGTTTMSQEAPTKDQPSIWSSDYGVGTAYTDANWAWAPEGGFALDRAEVSVTFHFTAPQQPTRGIDWRAFLFVDGDTVADVTTASETGEPGEVMELTLPFGEITATGSVLGLEIDAVFANEVVNAIYYDSIDTPSRVSIGANLVDTIPPSAVEGVSATAQNDTTIALGWTEATDDVAVDHYIVYRGTDPSTLAPVAEPAAATLLDEGLVPETTYYYQVSAVDVGGNEGATSDLVATTTLPSGSSGTVDPRPFTVVAIVDSSYSPYHFDFVGHQHPWNIDDEPDNDFDFTAHPSEYIEGYPSHAPAVQITVPTDPGANVADLRAQDQAAWDAMEGSSGSGEGVTLHWIPGTKIIGAVQYGSSFVGTNSAHGTRSAASAAGNIHGSCQECVFVLVQGLGNDGVTWAANQPWIDVVSNSWESCYPTCLTRTGLYPFDPIEDWREASQDGQFIVFAAGNGHANAFVAPQLGYTSSQKGTDWVVKVGAVSPSSKQSYSGSTKPVDISAVGSSYPSTGGSTATGGGTHSGTSNAAPVVAGTLARVIQESRELLGDVTPGFGGGILAEGTPVPCGTALPACPLGDGILTREEARELVFKNVLPDTGISCCATTWPNTEYNHAYQGHGVVFGHIDGEEAYQAQIDQMLGVATGEAEPPERPEGEQTWFITDSKCRQHLWGTWDGGYYTGTDPDLDPETHPLAFALDTWCQAMAPGLLP